MFKNKYKYASTTVNNKARKSLTLADFDGLRRLIALNTCETERDLKIKV
jgi:hypothetical protein